MEVDDNSVNINVVSCNGRVHDSIKKYRDDRVSAISYELRRLGYEGFSLLKADGTELVEDWTIEQSNLVDGSSVYVFLGNVTLPVTNPTGEEGTFGVEITKATTGRDMRFVVSKNFGWNSDWLILFIIDKKNTKYEMIEDNRFLFTYEIRMDSIVKWVGIKSFGHIEFRMRLNSSDSFAGVFKAVDGQQEMAVKEYNVNCQEKDPLKIISMSKAFGNELINSWRLEAIEQSGWSQRIVRRLGMYRYDSKLYFAMELMKGSLRDVIDRQTCKHLTDDYVKKYTRQIIEGLCFLHENKIIQRNLKCSSVLLDDAGNIKLGGVGLSKYMLDCTGNEDSLIIGMKGSKPVHKNWTSPETLEHSIWSIKTDVWSLGATVLEMRTGNKPYHDKKPSNAARLIMTDKKLVYDRPPNMDDVTYRKFKDFIECCTKANPGDRWMPRDLLGHEYLN